MCRPGKPGLRSIQLLYLHHDGSAAKVNGKDKQLFGSNQNACFAVDGLKLKVVLLTEGVADSLAIAQVSGLRAAAAITGSAMPRAADALMDAGHHRVPCAGGDDAGRKWSNRAGLRIEARLGNYVVINWPADSDPGDEPELVLPHLPAILGANHRHEGTPTA